MLLWAGAPGLAELVQHTVPVIMQEEKRRETGDKADGGDRSQRRRKRL